MKVSEQIAIMKAYEDGKTIEMKHYEETEWKSIKYIKNYPFDFSYYMAGKPVSDLTQCQDQEKHERRRRKKTPSERNRIMRRWALRKVDRQIAMATDKVVVYPYRLQPSLGVTEREQLLFEKYKFLYL